MYFKVRIQGNPSYKERDQELQRMRKEVQWIEARIKAENPSFTPEIKLFVEEGYLDGPYRDLGLMEVEEFERLNLGEKE